MEILGIDIGGTGIKGALVDSVTGEMLTKRFRIPTPPSRKPKEMAEVVKQIIKHFDYKGPVGCGFPVTFRKGVCVSYGNLHKKWLGVKVDDLFSEATGLPLYGNQRCRCCRICHHELWYWKREKRLRGHDYYRYRTRKWCLFRRQAHS